MRSCNKAVWLDVSSVVAPSLWVATGCVGRPSRTQQQPARTGALAEIRRDVASSNNVAINIGEGSQRPTHHVHELREVDLAVSVRVDLFHELHDGLGANHAVHILMFKHCVQLLLGDLAVATPVK